MTKLISGRVAKVPSANVSTDRYDFIDLAETEPDLGLPPGSGYVLTSTIQGVRSWLNPVEFSGVANVSIFSGRANVATLADFANVANVVTTLSNFTTANLVEGINLYFTNARVVSALTAGDQIIIEANGRISANVAAVPLDAAAVNAIVQPFLTTANVIESSSNLYFTAERVNATVQPFLTAANIANFASTVNVTVQPFLTAANIVNFASTVNATVQPFLTTANVKEISGNLYFTNTRVVSALVAGDNISIESNGRISANITAAINDIANISLTIDNLTTDGITEGTVNLYYTNTRVVSALTAGDNITIESNGRISANVQQTTTASLNLTTADVRETSNLYFTNTRSREAISGSTGVIYDSSTGEISIGQNVATTASVTFKDVFVSNNLVVYGTTTTWGANNLVVSDNMIYLNNLSNNSNPDLGISFNYYDGVYHHAGFFRDASDGVFKVFDNYEPEPDANIFIDTDHNTFRLANLQATNYIGNVTGFVTGQVSSLDNHDTSSLKEGGNLYFTVERVNATVQPFLTTANVVETSGNLYFTNARVVSALVAGDSITIEANGRISANVSAVPLNAAAVNAIVQPFLTTANVVETSGNLYFTNARVVSALVAGDSITIEANGRISANVSASSVAAQVSTLSNFTTNDLAEGANALYYTNARARTAYTAGTGIAITQAGVISFKQADPGLGFYNSGLTLASAGIVSNIYSNVVMFNSENGVNFIVQSLHITNLSSNTAYVNGRIGYSDGSNVVFANLFELPGSSSTEMFLKPAVFKPSDSIQLQSFSNPKQPANNLISAMVSYQGSAITEFDRAYAVLNSNSTSNVFVSSGKNSIIESIKVHNPNPRPAGITTQIVTDTNQIFAFLSSNLIVPAFSTVEICEYPKTLLSDYTIRMQKSPSFAQPLTAFISAKYTSFFTATPSLSTIGEVAGANVVTIDFQTLGVTNGTTFYYSTEGNVNASDFVPVGNTGSFVVTSDQGSFNLQLASDTGFEGEERFRVQIRRASVTGTVIASTSNIIIKDTGNTEYVLVSPAVNTPQNEGNTITFNITVYNPTTSTYYYTTKNMAGNVFAPRFSSANTGAFVIAGHAQSNTVSLVANADGITNGDGIFQLEIRSGSTTGTIANTSSNVTIVDTSQFGLLATGGNFVETVGDYKRHVFLSSNTFSVAGLGGNNQVQVLVIAGGGGGYVGGPGTGGGAGGLLTQTQTLSSAENYTITIGGGGVGSTSGGNAPTMTNGGRSEFRNTANTLNISTMGGGRAGAFEFPPSDGLPGGSGGGATYGGSIGGAGMNYPGPTQQGYPGGNRDSAPGAGGGGAGGAGSPSTTGNGGPGTVVPFSPGTYGTPGPAPGSRYFAGGGAGGVAGTGGVGGGGGLLVAGTINTGGGGGSGYPGGSGIVIITYRIQ